MDCPECYKKISLFQLLHEIRCIKCNIKFKKLLDNLPNYNNYYVYTIWKNGIMIYVGVSKNIKSLKGRLTNHKNKTGLTFTQLTYENMKKKKIKIGISFQMGEKMIYDIYKPKFNLATPPIKDKNNINSPNSYYFVNSKTLYIFDPNTSGSKYYSFIDNNNHTLKDIEYKKKT